MRKQQQDVSNTTVSVMLVLVIFVSVLSLAIFFNALAGAEPLISSSDGGKLSFNVLKNTQNIQRSTSVADSQLGLTVLRPGG